MPTVRYIDPRIEETAAYMPPSGRVYRGPVESSQLYTLSQVEIEQLVRTLYFCRPADTQDAQDRWLAFQKSRIRDLNVPLTRTRGIIQQVATTVSRHGLPFVSDHAHLCWTHKDLNAKLIRALTLLVAKECTQRVDGFRYCRRKGKLDDITDRWLTGIDNITTLWIGQDKASKVIKYYSTYRPPVLVDNSCEACKLAVLGGTGNMLRDLRAGLLARSEYQGDLGSTDTQPPLLLDFVNAWLSTCYSSNRRRTLTIESEELVPVILSLRHGRRLRRQQKAEDRHRRGKHDLMYDQDDYTESIQAPGREPLPYTSWDRIPSICLQPPAEGNRRVSRLEIEEAELAQHHPSLRMRAPTPYADISSVAYWESRGQGKDFEDLMQRHSADMDDDGAAISDLESLPGDLDDHPDGHRNGNDHGNMQGFPAETESEERWMSGYRKFVHGDFDHESHELLQPKTYVPPEVRSKQYFEDDDCITDDYSPAQAQAPVYDYQTEEQRSSRTRPQFEYPDYSPTAARAPVYEEQISPRTRPQLPYPDSDIMPTEPVRADGSVFDYRVHETSCPSAYSTIVPGTRASVQSDDFRLPSPAVPTMDKPSVFDYQVEYFSDEEPEEEDDVTANGNNGNNGNNSKDKPLPWVPGPKFSYYNTSSAYSTDPVPLPGRQSLEERPEVLSPIPVHPSSQTADVREGWPKYPNVDDGEKVQNASPPSLCVTPVAPLALVLHSSAARRNRAASHRGSVDSSGGFVRSGAPSPEEMPPVQQSKVHATQDGYVERDPQDSIKSMCASIAEVASCYSTMGWGGPQESAPNPEWVPVRRR